MRISDWSSDVCSSDLLGYLIAKGRQFQPTPRVMRLSAAYLSAATLPELARPLLADARDRLGESLSLTLFDDGFVVFVARSEVTRVVSTGFRIGKIGRAHV